MRGRIVQVFAVAVALAVPLAAQAQHHRAGTQTKQRATTHSKSARSEPPPLPCGDYLRFQVLLDRQGFSPGQIDGKPGPNFSHAVAAMRAARKLPASGAADCDAWHALGGDHAGELIATYTVTDADADGPYEPDIPGTFPEQAALTALSYKSPLEEIAEKFHASPALLQQLNEGVPLTAGTLVTVPAVQPFDATAKPAPDPAAADVTIVVSRDDSSLRAIRPDGTVLFFAPVTTGSEHDPLPIGEWKVNGVQWYPSFHYNPRLFWDAKPGDTKATIKPGPNNPVGVVWIDIDVEHYGLHGTPEPSKVGHAESHGCVRLTNWDAARVAALVHPGTRVQFR